jgi:hypothetical protein
MNYPLKIDPRFSEPSTYAGLATGVIAIAQALPPTWAQFLYPIAGFFSTLAVILREKSATAESKD